MWSLHDALLDFTGPTPLLKRMDYTTNGLGFAVEQIGSTTWVGSANQHAACYQLWGSGLSTNDLNARCSIANQQGLYRVNLATQGDTAAAWGRPSPNVIDTSSMFSSAMIQALAEYKRPSDGASLLAVGGQFLRLDDNTVMRNVGLFNPATNSWTVLGPGIQSKSAGMDTVLSLGQGPDGNLYIGGLFYVLGDGTTAAMGLAAWDGTTLAPVPCSSIYIAGTTVSCSGVGVDQWGWGKVLAIASYSGKLWVSPHAAARAPPPPRCPAAAPGSRPLPTPPSARPPPPRQIGGDFSCIGAIYGGGSTTSCSNTVNVGGIAIYHGAGKWAALSHKGESTSKAGVGGNIRSIVPGDGFVWIGGAFSALNTPTCGGGYPYSTACQLNSVRGQGAAAVRRAATARRASAHVPRQPSHVPVPACPPPQVAKYYLGQDSKAP